MKTHLSISLYLEKESSPFSFSEFKEKMANKIEEKLLEWKSEPLLTLTEQDTKDSEYTIRFNDIYKFRHSIYNLIQKNYNISEMNIANAETFTITFNVNSIINSDYHIKDHSESMFKSLGVCEKGHFNIIDIITELTVKIKSSFYEENMDYMFENKVDEISESLKQWADVSRNMKRISHYI